MRRWLGGCGAVIALTVGTVVPLTSSTPVAAATVATGVVSGLLTWCIPPVTTTTLSGSGGATTSTTPPIAPVRILEIPPPSSVEFLQRGVLVRRAQLDIALKPIGPTVTPSYDGEFLAVARFVIRMRPGNYELLASAAPHHVRVVAGHITRVRARLSTC
jgi:hypothetical protein